MSIVGVFAKVRPDIGGIYFDAILEESSELVSEVSEYPLENAATAQDNVVTRNLSVTMTVAMSDNWYKALINKAGDLSTVAGIAGGVLGGAVLGQLSGGAAAIGGILASVGVASISSRPSIEALEEIRKLQEAGQPLKVVGVTKTYKNMIITSTRTTASPENEGGTEIVVEMVQLRTVKDEKSADTVNANLANDSTGTQGQATANFGEVAVS